MVRPVLSRSDNQTLADFCRYVPLRLSSGERALLAVLENTLHVSEYTDHVDVSSARRVLKARRILDGILEACHISTGLAVASAHEQNLVASCAEAETKTGKAKKSSSRRSGKNCKQKKAVTATREQHSSSSSWAGRDPKENAAFFQTMFEIGRRNKILNPSRMRSTYGKLMYLLQDAQNPTVAKSLGFSLHKDIVLVAPYLEDNGCGDLLNDSRLEGATKYVSDRDETTGERLDRNEVEKRVAQKRALLEELANEYSKTGSEIMTEDNVRRCIESISDAIAFVETNVAPVQRMLKHLEENFDPDQPESPFSLRLTGTSRFESPSGRYGLSAFREGSSGATLSHSHSTQYTFVWQSLRLWYKVQLNMHKLWVCADEDLLSTSTTYHLYNTGQGLNRVQACPQVRKVMSSLLHATQKEAGSPWVGLSVIHLGDRDVPNALIFIDKYTQIPRFLNPIVDFLQGLPELCEDKRIEGYIKEQFRSQRNLKMTVLADYFKHGFDGSGDDGGSCIDGRLTSSWNWTSRVAKKTYYHSFMLSGFQGFDGDFK